MSDHSDLVQRARQALDGITEGPWHAIGRLIGDLLTEVERLRELATEVEQLRGEIERIKGTLEACNDAQVEVAETERDEWKVKWRDAINHADQIAAEDAELRATIERVRKLVDKQIAVSESHTDDDFNTAQIAHVTASLLHRIRQTLDGKTES